MLNLSLQFFLFSDISTLALLCALISYNSDELHTLLDEPNFIPFLEAAPEMRAAILSFMSRKFKEFFNIIRRVSDSLSYSPLLVDSIDTILSQIRESTIHLYIQPFSAVSFDRMAADFNESMKDTEDTVTSLVLQGTIPGIIDSHNHVSNLLPSHLFFLSSFTDSSFAFSLPLITFSSARD